MAESLYRADLGDADGFERTENLLPVNTQGRVVQWLKRVLTQCETMML